MHSSREELEWALQLLAPKLVVSTTPSCRAMELNYVRKHCGRITSDDRLWKLLGIDVEASSILDVSADGVGCASMVEGPTEASSEPELQPVKRSSGRKELLSLSPPGKRPPVTLFGRARLGLEDHNFSCEEKKMESKTDDPQQIIVNKTEQELSYLVVNAEVNCEIIADNKGEIYVTAGKCGKLLEKEVGKSSFCSSVGFSCKEKKIESITDDSLRIIANRTEQEFLSDEVDAEVNHENKSESKVEVDVTAVQCAKLAKKEVYKSSFHSSIGSSRSYSDSMRKLYRSMNVPVPRPLPSLVELMNPNKRAKRRFEF